MITRVTKLAFGKHMKMKVKTKIRTSVKLLKFIQMKIIMILMLMVACMPLCQAIRRISVSSRITVAHRWSGATVARGMSIGDKGGSM
jgi:fumarate reductase subunit D